MNADLEETRAEIEDDLGDIVGNVFIPDASDQMALAGPDGQGLVVVAFDAPEFDRRSYVLPPTVALSMGLALVECGHAAAKGAVETPEE